MEKHWQIWGEECPSCGGESEVYTVATDPYMGYDQDEARCMECHCPGILTVNDEVTANIDWDVDNHDPGCACQWCRVEGE